MGNVQSLQPRQLYIDNEVVPLLNIFLIDNYALQEEKGHFEGSEEKNIIQFSTTD